MNFFDLLVIFSFVSPKNLYISLNGALLPNSLIPKFFPFSPTYFFQQSLEPASIDILFLV
jgi:hypothetical protein